MWAWLNDPATFVEGQAWPWRIEFVDGGFEPGVLNVHHGPFLNVAGVIEEVQNPGKGRLCYQPLVVPSDAALVLGRETVAFRAIVERGAGDLLVPVSLLDGLRH